MWEKVDKSKLVQYKLKVDLNQDVQKLMVDGPDDNRQTEITNVVGGVIKDKMIVDSREQAPKSEETKEKPEMQRFQKPGSLNQGRQPGYTGARMEDIKEQDSEADIANSGVYQSQKEAPKVAKASVATPKQPTNVNVSRKISEA